jgi:hypothetical protein
MSTAKRKRVDPRTRKPTPESLRQLGHTEGKAVQLAANDAAVRELRADAAAIERTAQILRAMPASDVSFARQDVAVQCLRSMAAGFRVAADRVPSTDVPF